MSVFFSTGTVLVSALISLGKGYTVWLAAFLCGGRRENQRETGVLKITLGKCDRRRVDLTGYLKIVPGFHSKVMKPGFSGGSEKIPLIRSGKITPAPS